MSEPLLKALRAAGQEAEAIEPYLNRGGCGVYAALVVSALERRGIKAWARASMRSPGRITINKVRQAMLADNVRPERAGCAEWNNHGIDFQHVLVQFHYRGRLYTHDSRTLISQDLKIENTCLGRVIPGRVTRAEVRAIAADAFGWSPSFDRGKILPIARAIRRRLSEARV